MLRFFFWTLLLLNAILLASNLGFLGNWATEKHEPQRFKMQKKADQLQLLSAPAAQLLSDAAAEKAEKAEKAEQAEQPEELIACLEIGPFAQLDAPRVEGKLKQLALGARQSRSNVAEVASNMVFIPPLANKESAEKKAAELRRMGISDFFIVQDQSDMRWGISLGVFKTEEAAKAHLANLAGKGVKSARIGPRSVSAQKFAYQLHSLSAEEKKRFDALKSELPNQESRECAVPATGRN